MPRVYWNGRACPGLTETDEPMPFDAPPLDPEPPPDPVSKPTPGSHVSMQFIT